MLARTARSISLKCGTGKVCQLAMVLLVALLTACGDGHLAPTSSARTANAFALTPQAATVAVRQSQQFRTIGSGSAAVSKWSVTGSGCLGTSCGTIDKAGFYRAPAALPHPSIVTVRAVSTVNPSHIAETIVNLAASVEVSLTPSTAQVAVGAQKQFVASVTGASNPVVTWNLSGAGCVGVTCGTLTGAGLYTAPAKLPSPPLVTIKASSLADPSASASAAVSLTGPPPMTIAITPGSAQLRPGSQQQFTSTVTGTSDTAVTWNAQGPGCTGFTCGLITQAGLYTAPSTIPNPPTVSVVAVSHADSSKFAVATVSFSTTVGVSVLPAAVQLAQGAQKQFTATVTGTTNSAITWSVTGPGCSGASCGTISATGLYTAPALLPSPPTISVTAKSVADPAKFGTATVTIVAGVTVTVSPSSVHVSPGASQAFSATVAGASSQVVVWNLSGAGCAGISCGQISGAGVYTAPSVIPNPNLVTVKATSLADSSKSGTASVLVGAASSIAVSVSPSSRTLGTGQQQQFTATVTGSTNTAVTWGVTGIGCAGASCGTLTSEGLYTAPATVPTPSYVTVKATAQADPSRSATAIVSISPNVRVSISPATVQVTAGTQQQFTASVTGSSTTTVLWSVSGSGCAGASCGTISSTGLYRAPASFPSPPTVTVKATAQADPSKSASATVTVVPPVVISVAPATVEVVTSASQQFAATLTGTTETAVNWSISGSACSGSACGSVTSAGLYTAPAAIPASTVLVTATSQANPSRTASATVTVIPRNENKLNGQYAFLFRGFDASGPYVAAGSFVADGAGHIANGVQDINRSSGPANKVEFTGTYTVGGDNRGSMTISSSQGPVKFAVAVNSTGKHGRMISTDASGVRGSGVFRLQSPSAFSISAITGGYTLGLTGNDSFGGPVSVLASIFPSGAGTVSGSSLDTNDAGSTLPTFTGFSGTNSIGANGRGTLSLTVPFFGSGFFNFAVYVVSANELFLVSTDPLSPLNPVLAGSALQQSGGPFFNASFEGFSIFSQTGSNFGSPDVSVGLLAFDGVGTVNMQVDQNRGGVITIGHTLSGTYDVEPNGRITLNLVDSETFAPNTQIMYAVSPNTAFIMDMSVAVRTGLSEAQTIVPPFENAVFAGSTVFGSDSPAGAALPLRSGTAFFDGVGKISGTDDANLSSGLATGRLLGGTYSVSMVSANGRGAVLLSSPAPQTLALWLVTYSKAVALPVSASDLEPVLLVFEQ